MPARALKSGAPTVIFDADFSTDIDDAGALALLHALADLGECSIIGMGVSSTNGSTPLAMDAINNFYGRAGIPIGVRPDIGGGGNYPAAVATDFAHPTYASASQCPLAVTLFRQLLAAAPDASITLISTGYLTNLAALLASPADAYSALTGRALVAQKVKQWVCMGGQYPSGAEFNFNSSGDDSAYQVVNSWPTAALFAGYEVGVPITVGASMVAGLPSSNPVRRAFQAFSGGLPRAAWDQIAVYAAMRLSEGVFDTQSVGSNTVAANGSNAWVSSPDPSGATDQKYLINRTSMVTLAATVIDLLSMAPPAAGNPVVAPMQPTNLRVTAVSASAITLEWTVNSYNETAVVVERRDSGTWVTAASLPAGARSWTDPNPITTNGRNYRVKALNATGPSTASAATTLFPGSMAGRERIKGAEGGDGAPSRRLFNQGGVAVPVASDRRAD